MRGHDDLPLLLDAATRAGEIARAYLAQGLRVQEKPDGQGPVTDADLAVDAMLRETLTAARPDYGWLSEETGDSPARLSRKRVFVVDPIDGTRAFIDGQAGFSHVLTVVENGQPICAVVHLPISGLTYAAYLGGGASLNSQAISVSARTTLQGADVLAARPHLLTEHWPGGAPDVQRHFRPSLAWRLALVAEGKFDAMLTLRPTWHWDIAAGCLLVTEAGGQISDAQGERLVFNTPRPSAQGIIAANPDMHNQLIARRLPQSGASLTTHRFS